MIFLTKKVPAPQRAGTPRQVFDNRSRFRLIILHFALVVQNHFTGSSTEFFAKRANFVKKARFFLRQNTPHLQRKARRAGCKGLCPVQWESEFFCAKTSDSLARGIEPITVLEEQFTKVIPRLEQYSYRMRYDRNSSQ